MLNLKIDGAWEPQDFIQVLQAVESFYYKLTPIGSRRSRMSPFWLDEEYYVWRSARSSGLTYESALDQINQRLLERARYETPSYGRLRVDRIHYASPGGIDLLGIGKVFETLANSVGRIKVYYDETHIRRERDEQAKLDTELKRLQIEKERETLQSLKIKNAQDALTLLDAHPEVHDALVPLLVRDQDALASRIAEQKLISANVVSSDREGG